MHVLHVCITIYSKISNSGPFKKWTTFKLRTDHLSQIDFTMELYITFLTSEKPVHMCIHLLAIVCMVLNWIIATEWLHMNCTCGHFNSVVIYIIMRCFEKPYISPYFSTNFIVFHLAIHFRM